MSQDWSKWWFLNGGTIHGAWKQRAYSRIKELAMLLPKAAWDHQQAEIDALRKKVQELQEKNGELVLLANEQTDMLNKLSDAIEVTLEKPEK